jgi:hypothetical protein
MNRFFKKADILLILFFCAVCAVMFIPRFTGSGNLNAIIYKNGEEIYRIDLSKVSSGYSIDLDSNPASVVRVENGAIGYVHSDCPDKLCVNAGMLTRRGQTAACLPAKTIIVLAGGKKDSDRPDVITY